MEYKIVLVGKMKRNASLLVKKHSLSVVSAEIVLLVGQQSVLTGNMCAMGKRTATKGKVC